MLASVCNDGCSRRESAHQGAHGQIAHTSLVVYFMQRADCIPTPLVFQSIEVLVSVTLRLLSVEDTRAKFFLMWCYSYTSSLSRYSRLNISCFCNLTEKSPNLL